MIKQQEIFRLTAAVCYGGENRHSVLSSFFERFRTLFIFQNQFQNLILHVMKKEKRKNGIARLLEIAGEKKWLLVLAGLLSACSAVCMLIPYWSVYEILKELLRSANAGDGIDNKVIVYWGWNAFYGLIGGLAALYASLMASHAAAFRILYGLRIRMSEHIGMLPLGYLNNTSTGAIKKIMEHNIEKIETFIAHTIPDLVNVFTTAIAMLLIFFSVDLWLALVCLLVVVISIAIQFSSFVGKKARMFTHYYYNAQENMSSSAVQYVRGMPIVKIFGQSVMSFKHFNAEIEAYKNFALKVCDSYQDGMVLFTVMLNSIVTFLLPTGLLIWQNSPTSLSFAIVWVFFIIMGSGVTSPIYKLMYLGSSTREIDEGVARLVKIFEQQQIFESKTPQKPNSFDIQFVDVSFYYENTDQATRTEALKNISFTAKQNEITALVGPSGSGKSTIANLIPRFWDVNKGEILIGGINIKQIAIKDLMEIVSFVFQDAFLFTDTIYENIAVGCRTATKEDVVKAAKAAQCHDFIAQLPNGYQTKIGGEGVYLSGGESQRICVARAILKNAPILVLDEATAFADSENEYKMQHALKELIKNKTVIIIAHRLSSIISANNIIVLNNGKIEQQGIHHELCKAEGLYKKMWEAYTSAYKWELNNKTRRK